MEIVKLLIVFLAVMFLVAKKKPMYLAILVGAAAAWI